MPPLPTGAVKAQVKRMAGLAYFPNEPEAVRELVNTLARRCANVTHVEAVIERWLVSHSEAPKPTDLIAEIETTRPRETLAPDPACKQCDGTGFVSETRPYKLLGETYEADCVKPCECRSGTRK